MKKFLVLFVLIAFLSLGVFAEELCKPKPPKITKIEGYCIGENAVVKLTVKNRDTKSVKIEVWRKAGPGGYWDHIGDIKSVAGNKSAVYTDETAPNNNPNVHYKVRAVRSGKKSGWSNAVKIKTKNCKNTPPVCKIIADPITGFVPLTVYFNGGNSYDPDGDTVTHKWKFGDGSISGKVKPTHTFLSAGVYNVVHIVTDSRGATDSCSVQITVTTPPDDNKPPVCTIEADPVKGYVPLTVHFDGSKSYDPDGDTVTHKWKFGDGSVSGKTKPVHKFLSPGVYNVTHYVTDSKGATDSCSVQITVLKDNSDPDPDPEPVLCDVIISIERSVSWYITEEYNGYEFIQKPQILIKVELLETNPNGYFIVHKITRDRKSYTEPIIENLQKMEKLDLKFKGDTKFFEFTDRDIAPDTVVTYLLEWICDNPCEFKETGQLFEPIVVLVPKEPQD